MALKRNEVNPLGILNLRKLSFIPEHFQKMNLDAGVNIKLLDHWINYHLNSRYAIQRGQDIDSNNRVIQVWVVGLEDGKDLTMLSLACPYLTPQPYIPFV